MKTMKWSLNRIKNRDIFKQTVSLTFNKKDSYTTVLGGFSTIFLFGFIFIYGSILIIDMFNKSQVSWNKNTYWKELSKDTESVKMTDEDPQIYLQWKGVEKIKDLDKDPNDYLYSTFKHLSKNKGEGKDQTIIKNFE